jgi:F0F1-type ATP synthase assembly protein I
VRIRGLPDRDPSARRRAAAYQGAVEAVFAIFVAMGIGWWADSRYGTSPRWLLVGLGVGFGSFVLRLWRMRTLIETDAADPDGSKERSETSGDG